MGKVSILAAIGLSTKGSHGLSEAVLRAGVHSQPAVQLLEVDYSKIRERVRQPFGEMVNGFGDEGLKDPDGLFEITGRAAAAPMNFAWCLSNMLLLSSGCHKAYLVMQVLPGV